MRDKYTGKIIKKELTDTYKRKCVEKYKHLQEEHEKRRGRKINSISY